MELKTTKGMRALLQQQSREAQRLDCDMGMTPNVVQSLLHDIDALEAATPAIESVTDIPLIQDGFSLVATAVLEALVQTLINIASRQPTPPSPLEYRHSEEFRVAELRYEYARQAQQALQFAQLAADEPAADGEDDEAPTTALERGAQS